MTFPKYPLKTQLILALIFSPLNFLTSYIFCEVLKLPLFMDMIFVYAASFFGIPCGVIVGTVHCLANTLIFQSSLKHFLFVICCITGTLLTRLIITRHEDFHWVRLFLLFLTSTILISLEGSIISSFLLTTVTDYTEISTILFLTYTLIMQNLNMQLSAFFARLPLNLFDKAIAVTLGFGIYIGTRNLMARTKDVCDNKGTL